MRLHIRAAVLMMLVGIAASQSQLSAKPTPSGEIPSGYVPAQCEKYLGKANVANRLLNCYLGHPSNQTIANQIEWTFDGQWALWAQWPATAKADLVNAFVNTVSWYNGGMTYYPGVLPMDPPDPINLQYLLDGNPGLAVYDDLTAAWPLYIGHVALSLAAEIYGWVPWSLKNFDNEGLGAILSNSSFFQACNYGAAGYCAMNDSLPANATVVFKFFRDNGLIGATKKATIFNVLNWSRRLWHTGCGSLSYDGTVHYFQHYGEPPVSRILEGTVNTCPTDPNDSKDAPHHWTAGCPGTSGFLATIFRAVNIPVSRAAVANHMSPYFRSEKLYLSHGDDLYNDGFAPEAPASLLPIDEAKYQAWFPANDFTTAEWNVGRRVYELNVSYPSKMVLDLYCDDLALGKTHATGKVFNEYFSKYYTVPQLESLGLWTRLNYKMQTYGCAW